jgi:hypothetical protein
MIERIEKGNPRLKACDERNFLLSADVAASLNMKCHGNVWTALRQGVLDYFRVDQRPENKNGTRGGKTQNQGGRGVWYLEFVKTEQVEEACGSLTSSEEEGGVDKGCGVKAVQSPLKKPRGSSRSTEEQKKEAHRVTRSKVKKKIIKTVSYYQ